MKNSFKALFVALPVILSICGCVPQTYKKTVTTTLNGNGQIMGTVIEETITEPHSSMPRIAEPVSGSVKLNNIQK